MNLQERKRTRLKGYNYSHIGAYFITICVKDREEILSKIIVGDGVLDIPKNILTEYGETATRIINQMSSFYDNVSIVKYVVMPNHIHFILRVSEKQAENGTSGTPSPTNSVVSRFISSYKRFCNKEYGRNIWQRSYHDHIIRNEKDYLKIWEYIDTNIYKWEKDCFYIKKPQ